MDFTDMLLARLLKFFYTCKDSKNIKICKKTISIPVVLAMDIYYSKNDLLLIDNFTALKIGHYIG